MKKRILFLGRFPMPIHGAAKMNELYFNSSLIKDNFDLDRVKLGESSNLENIGKFNLRKITSIFSSFFKILSKISNFKPDLVYFEIPATGTAFLRDSIYAILCKLLGKKILFHLHSRGIREKTKNIFWKGYYKLIFKNTKVILLSDIIYNEIENIVSKQDIHILPNGIEDELSEKEFNRILLNRKKNKKPLLLFISNMIEEKGALDVLKICKELDKKGIDFECDFAGPWQEMGFREKWERLLQEFELANKCKYIGPKYSEERKKLFSNADFMLFPTRYKNESFPLVILEAFMNGIPVYSYNNGAIKEMISEKYLGFVADMGKWDYLAKELIPKIKKRGDSKKIRKHFKENYTIKKAEHKLVKIFQGELK